MAVIFISYRRKDSGGHAGRLHEELVRRYGRESIFMDIDSLHGGVEFRDRIHEALDASDTALVLIGETWTGPTHDDEARRIDREDDLVRREVAGALAHKTVTVVPILVEEAELPGASELPEELSSLRNLHVCRLRNSEWKSDVRRIAQAVDDSNRGGWGNRLAQGLRQRPRQIAAALILALVAGLAIVAMSSGGSRDEGCVNENVPPDARARLTAAAGSNQPAVEGSVYYGTCGKDVYAIAAFPGAKDGVFLQSGQHWVDLGPVAAEKCDRVPPELLDEWNLNNC
jgi:hypothetical protein